MKKKLTALCLVFLLALTLSVPALAEDDGEWTYVADEAGILSEEEVQTLDEEAQRIAEETQCALYIITLDDFTQYIETDDIEEAARQLYFGMELGYGEDKSGMLLMMSMADRHYALYAYGYGNTAFTDYGKEYIADDFCGPFGDDDWYGGFQTYLSTGESMILDAQAGTPIDVDSIPVSGAAKVMGVVACILLGFLIAFIVQSILKHQMKSVAEGTEADAFVSGGLKLTDQYDHYTHTTQSRVYDPKESDSDSGGGTTIDSSGGSSSSGSF